MWTCGTTGCKSMPDDTGPPDIVSKYGFSVEDCLAYADREKNNSVQDPGLSIEDKTIFVLADEVIELRKLVNRFKNNNRYQRGYSDGEASKLGPGWVPSYNDPDNASCAPIAEPIDQENPVAPWMRIAADDIVNLTLSTDPIMPDDIEEMINVASSIIAEVCPIK